MNHNEDNVNENINANGNTEQGGKLSEMEIAKLNEQYEQK